jgi:hypothetical protein
MERFLCPRELFGGVGRLRKISLNTLRVSIFTLSGTPDQRHRVRSPEQGERRGLLAMAYRRDGRDDRRQAVLALASGGQSGRGSRPARATATLRHFVSLPNRSLGIRSQKGCKLRDYESSECYVSIPIDLLRTSRQFLRGV